ncbi:PEP/pyruvate-binding domain-containing protein [Candidatus Nitrospira bockiana]
MSTYILPLGSCTEIALVGGKAAGLARLIAGGFAVPPGICLTTAAYTDAIRQGGLDPARAIAAARRAGGSPRSTELEVLRRTIASMTLPGPIVKELDRALDQLMVDGPTGELWAVRSSADREDSATRSFAGLHKTVLGVPRNEILPAVRLCWASLWEPAAAAYAPAAGRSHPAMAVIIQPLLAPRAAGVAFSQHPVTGLGTQVVVNAVPGLAEALVGGSVTPDAFTVETRGDGSLRVLQRIVVAKSVIRRPHEGRVIDVPVPEHERLRASLTDDEACLLAGLVKRVEATFGCPVDVEWALEDDRFVLLQARPISRPTRSCVLSDATSVWSRANFRETLPDVPSPLGLSFLQTFMETNILRHYRNLGCVIPPGLSSVRVIRGRPYINVSLFQSLMAQLGGDPALVAEQMGGCAPEPVSTERLSWWTRLSALLALEWQVRRAARKAPAWFAEMRRMAEPADGDQGSPTPAEVLMKMDTLGRRLSHCDLTFAIVSGVSQALYALRWLLEPHLATEWQALLNAALQGASDVVSARQILWLRALADLAQRDPVATQFFAGASWEPSRYRSLLAGTEFLDAFDDYLGEYGHRALGESDINSPRFSEKPDDLLGLIRGYLLAPPGQSVEDIRRQQASTRAEALARLEAVLGPHQRIAFRYWYRRLARYLALREANRHALMYFSATVRRLSVQLGRHYAASAVLEQGDDIFYLTAEEVRALVSEQPYDWKALVAARREAQKRHATLVADNCVVGVGIGHDRADRESDGTVHHGIPISAGYAEGPARLVRSPTDLVRIRKGEIIVTPVIDPGMVPYFGLARGLVAEMGGVLSHGAIIAREYGLPAVVNLPGIMGKVLDGDWVTVDATAGVFRRSGHRR